jgi:hypothetical protein
MGLHSGYKFLREPPGGPRSGGEAMSEAKPGRWRPEAKRRGTPKVSLKIFLKISAGLVIKTIFLDLPLRCYF